MDYFWSYFGYNTPQCPVAVYKQRSVQRKVSAEKLRTRVVKSQDPLFRSQILAVLNQLNQMDLTKTLRKTAFIQCTVENCPHHPQRFHSSKLFDELIKRVPKYN